MTAGAERERVGSLRVRGGSGQDFSNSCGAGADKNFNLRRTLVERGEFFHTFLLVQEFSTFLCSWPIYQEIYFKATAPHKRLCSPFDINACLLK